MTIWNDSTTDTDQFSLDTIGVLGLFLQIGPFISADLRLTGHHTPNDIFANIFGSNDWIMQFVIFSADIKRIK